MVISIAVRLNEVTLLAINSNVSYFAIEISEASEATRVVETCTLHERIKRLRSYCCITFKLLSYYGHYQIVFRFFERAR